VLPGTYRILSNGEMQTGVEKSTKDLLSLVQIIILPTVLRAILRYNCMNNNGAYLRAHILYIPPDRTLQMIFQSIRHNHLIPTPTRRPGMHFQNY
jgi:hypothetical protein